MSPLDACPACGEATGDPAARFCEACGASLQGAAAPARPAPALPDRERAVDAALAMACDRGRRHPTNQDAGWVERRADGAVLLCVADGVSSADNAEGASAAAIAAVQARFMASAADLTAEEQARTCVEAAIPAVLGVPRLGDDPDLDPPETTIVVAVVIDGEAGIAWVGDSRAYRLDEGRETLLTRDDSWARQAMERGAMSREAVARDPRAHAITQCLGMPAEDIDVHVITAGLPPGAALLLCTDGLWNYHDDDDGALAEAFADAGQGDAASRCRRLVAEANAMGGRDNITVALLLG